jgi:hypothetical protein
VARATEANSGYCLPYWGQTQPGANQLGVSLTPAGGNIQFLAPFHGHVNEPGPFENEGRSLFPFLILERLSIMARGELGMPRYYFIIETPDHTYDDPEGELLPSDGAAKDYGRRVVRELKENDFELAGAVLRVRDESNQTIDSILFWLP